MKKIVALLFVAAALVGRVVAQDFEGTVRWSMTAEISDPAVRAQMSQAQAQLASPEMQAQMEQARAAMNTPEMQAMMKNNPQMRAMIEKQMGALNNLPKPAAGGGGAGGMFPNKFVCKTKGTRALITVEGGMFPSETLSQGDKGVAYRLDRAQRTYRRLPTSLPQADEVKAKLGTDFKVTATGETAKIIGYSCKRYLVEQSGGAGADPREHQTYTVWATKDIPGLDSKKLEALRVGRESGPNFMTQIDGVPLKIEINTPQAKLVMQAESITRESLPASLFELPAGFTEAAM